MYYGQWEKMMNGEIPGMRELVESLKKKGYGVYGLSNWSAETFVPFVKDKYPVLKLLDGYVVSGFEKVKKPDPRLYHILLDRYGLKADECIFIDDSPDNIAAGEALGIRGIVFSSPVELKERLAEVLPE